MLNKVALIACLILLALMGAAKPSLAVVDKAVVRDLVVANSSRDLLVYCQVGDVFRPEMETGVLNGIPASLTFLVTLQEMKGSQPGRQLVELALNHTLSYDALREEFRLTLTETPEVQSCAKLDRARKLLSEVNGAKVIALAALTPGTTYNLAVKVRLERKSLPLFLNYLVPFWQLGDYESDWYHVKFKY